MSGVPKKLRQAMRLRGRSLLALREACIAGLGLRAIVLARRVSDLDRYIQSRGWLAIEEFDPIALGC